MGLKKSWESECLVCPPGMYCPSPGLNEPAGLCVEGHFCTLGATIPNPNNDTSDGGSMCSVGHFCPEGSGAPQPCPSGTYQPNPGQTSISACIPCDGGKFCLPEGQVFPTGNCSEGYFCSIGSSTNAPVDGITGDICPIRPRAT